MAEKITFTPFSYTGWGALEHLVEEVRKFNVQRILLVTDPFLEGIGIVKRVTEPLEQAGFTVDIYKDVVPEPPLSVGEKLVAYARQSQSELVIGLGGGSALDLAKCRRLFKFNRLEKNYEKRITDYFNSDDFWNRLRSNEHLCSFFRNN